MMETEKVEKVGSKNQEYRKMMKDIYHVSEMSGLKSFVWGGFVVDILQGEFTREHGDLDCFTEHLAENWEMLIAAANCNKPMGMR